MVTASGPGRCVLYPADSWAESHRDLGQVGNGALTDLHGGERGLTVTCLRNPSSLRLEGNLSGGE